MLKRIYIDNYKCLVNFEFVPDRLNLIVGRNGTGKSTLLEALACVRDVILGAPVAELFPRESCTRWQLRPTQSFELHVQGNDHDYVYTLDVEHKAHDDKLRIRRERLTCDGQPLFSFDQGEVQLYRDNYSEGPKYSADWTRSALAAVPDRHDNQKLTWFKEWCTRLWIVAPNPPLMESESKREEARLNEDMSNFASWYRYMQQEEPTAANELREELTEFIDGFVELKLASAGRGSRVLTVKLRSEADGAGDAHEAPYDFDEISDGHRGLIALYALLYFGLSSYGTLCIDEPINYIGLSEIQPWLVRMRERLEDGASQVFLISHNPEVINYLAPDAGKLFERTGGGPVRVRGFELDEGLTAAETIARGWV